MDLFNPYSSPGHENRLTWSFLTTLKYDLHLQKYIYETVTARFPELSTIYDGKTWEPANISTQTSRIGHSTQHLVSVLLTDEKIQDNIEVEWINRNAIYDGVIEYPTGLTLIVENKLDHENVWNQQLSPSPSTLPSNCRENVLLYNPAICLEWPEVLETILKYSYSEFASFSTRNITRDFLSFTEEFHPNLTPYRTYVLCGNRENALNRRTIRLIDNIATNLNLEYNQRRECIMRPGGIADRIKIEIITNLETYTWKLRINLWPASTSTQADRFHEELNRDDFLNLDANEWNVRPHLNFSYVGTKLHWATTDWNSETYLNYFFSQERPYGRKHRDELTNLMDWWSESSLISHKDTLEIERMIVNRDSLDINPEFWVYSELDSEDVVNLESQNKLESHIIESLDTPLATWGENL